MDVIIYDQNMTAIGLLEHFTSLTRTRRYWSAGDFSLIAPWSAENDAMLKVRNIVMILGDSEAMQILYCKKSRDTTGLETIEVQGQFLTWWLDTRLVELQIAWSGYVESVLSVIADANIIRASGNPLRTLPMTFSAAGSSYEWRGDKTFIAYSDNSVLKSYQDISKAVENGFRVVTTTNPVEHQIQLYTGKNRTKSQTTLPAVVFSEDYDNVIEMEFVQSIESYKNAIAPIVVNDGAWQPGQNYGGWFTVAGQERNEVRLKPIKIPTTLDASEMLGAYKAQMDEAAAKYKQTLAFNCKVKPSGMFEYRTDYDLGDVVTCVDARWGLSVDVRITEVTETYQGNVREVVITFGEALPTLTTKIQQLANLGG